MASAGSPPSYRCLAIAEIAERVCTHVEQKSALANLARVGRMTQDVALDALYNELRLEDLLKCMTDEVCAFTENKLVCLD